jgi:hypothetical protein
VGFTVGCGVGLIVGRGPGVGRRDIAAAGEGAVIDSTTGRAAAAAAPAPRRAINARRETPGTGPSTVTSPASVRSAIANATTS